MLSGGEGEREREIKIGRERELHRECVRIMYVGVFEHFTLLLSIWVSFSLRSSFTDVFDAIAEVRETFCFALLCFALFFKIIFLCEISF